MIGPAWAPATPLLDDLAPGQVARLAAALDLVEHSAHAEVLRLGEPAADGLSSSSPAPRACSAATRRSAS